MVYLSWHRFDASGMAPSLVTILKVHGEDEAPLRLHCLLGDALALRGSDGGNIWFAPVSSSLDGDGEENRLSFLYRDAEAERELRIDLGPCPTGVRGALRQLRSDSTAEAAEARWADIAERMMRVQRLQPPAAPPTAVLSVRSQHGVVAARRPAHPCHVIDRLMVRGRIQAGEQLECLLLAGMPDTLPKFCAG